MTARADKRRPLVAAILSIAAIGAALVAPVVIGARRGEPIPGSTVRAASGETVSITKPMTLFSSPAVTLSEGTVALVGPGAGESRVGAVLRALVLGGGADIVLDRTKLTVDRTSATTAPQQAIDAASETGHEVLGSIVSALSNFKFRSLALLDSTIVLNTVQGTAETLSNVNVEVATDRHGVVTAKGRIEYRSEPLDIDIAFTPPPEKAADAPVHVRASIKGNHILASFNGRIAPGDRGQISAQNAELSISDLRSAARWLGADWPVGPGLGAFSAKGHLTLDDRSIAFEHAQFALDGNSATGALAVTLKPERPSIEGTLAFATFDLAPYFAPSRPYALALASDWLSGLKVPGFAAPSLLREIDADVRISAGNVVSGSDRLGRCAASLSVKNGKLYGEIAELDLEQGGTGEGQFTVDMTGDEAAYTVRAHLDDIDFGTLASLRAGPAVLDGTGDLTLDLNAHGTSEGDIARSLAGTVSLDIPDSGRLGIDLDVLPKAIDAKTPPEGWGPVAAGTTAVNQLNARFTAANGVLTAGQVKAQAGDRAVDVTGTIDIDKSVVDLVLSIANAPGAASTAKPIGAFKVQGPWSAPSVTAAEPGKAARSTVSASDPG
ncbi:AsmA family protein [Hyphomicrobium sp. LHD-15]|uniref:AsmA family protein n=1 Tax=Hyphomicrobium sp. LHD-15 TaxID=3072142 RepID=UPI00280E8005|nr:AsmA family protein [Hyphomicrobium sp. LHD-15]MDQ8699998.1 AsmA family protein [Hyphomicrobium sp. LHD-15]